MSPGFREVLPKVRGVLADFRDPERVFTVLRDVEGRVRLVVEDISGPVAEPTLRALEDALRAALGPWLGEHTPVWGLRAKRDNLTPSERLIVEELDRSHVALDPNLYLVERHVAKAAWTGQSPYAPPWPRDDVQAGDKPPVVTFFSHKGGVGRTTALIATALLLAREGEEVVLLDLDLEAPGLAVLFGEKLVPDVGVLDLLATPGTSAPGTDVPDPPMDAEALNRAAFTVNDPALVGEGSLRVLTAGKLDDDYLEMLARLDVNAGSRRDELLRRMRALFQGVEAAWSPKWILVDARAGFHDLGGLMLASLSHAAVMVLTANPQSEHGLRRVARLLSAPNQHDKKKRPIPLVLAHGLAPERGAGGTLERERVRDAAHDILTQEYYPTNGAPSLTAEGVAHDPLPLPWVPSLRGRGGQLDPEVAELLREAPYPELLERLRGALR